MTQSQTSYKKPFGRIWALILAFIGYGSGMKNRQEGNFNEAGDSFLMSVITLVGITLYTLGKRRKEGKGFNGSIIIEGIIFMAILYVFGMGYLNTGWSNNPLVWFVVPFWILTAYLILVFRKQKK